MKPEEHLEVDEVVGAFADVVKPIVFINYHARRLKHTNSLDLIKRYWCLSALLFLLIDGILIHFRGFDFDEKLFLVTSLTILNVTQLLIQPMITLTLLKLARLRVTWTFIVIVFTPVVIFSPVSYLVSFPLIFQRYDLMNLFYRKGFGLDEAIAYMGEHREIINNVVTSDFFWSFLSTMVSIVEYYLLVIVCEAITLISKRKRFPVYVIVVLASTISGLPNTIIKNAEYVLVASYAPAKLPN